MLMQMQLQMQNQMNTLNMNSTQPGSQMNSARKPPLAVNSARDLTGQGFPVMT